jgi:hypothetical protein
VVAAVQRFADGPLPAGEEVAQENAKLKRIIATLNLDVLVLLYPFRRRISQAFGESYIHVS